MPGFRMKTKSYFMQRQLKKESAKEQFIGLHAAGILLASSEHWMKIHRRYIPKNYIIGTYTIHPSSMRSRKVIRLYFYLITGEEVFLDFQYHSSSELDRVIDECRNILPDALVLMDLTVCHWTYRKENRKRMFMAVTKRLPDQNAWFQYIYQRPEPFIDLLAGKTVKKPDYYKPDDSDLYFQEFPDEL